MLSLKVEQPARHPNPTVRAKRLAYLIWERPDLDLAEAFLTDFGLSVVARNEGSLFLRGTAAAPFCYLVKHAPQARFVGFALEVASRADLEKLASLPGVGSIEPLDSPGDGEVVHLTDPSGFCVDAVFGQQTLAALPQRAALNQHNNADAQPRLNATQRTPVAVPEVVKLGHVVLEVADFQDTCGWYTQHFGFIPSDVQLLPDGSPAVTFLRLDLDETPADHHTLAMAQGFCAVYSHSAYELVDGDAVGMGQRVLRERGYRHAWGLGRHILGSQIFDYWRDPWGDQHEHYSDGDLFTADHPTGLHPVSREAMSQWGPPMPRDFTRPKLNFKTLAAIIHNLRRSPDLSVRKLLTLAKLFG